jgi:hypothetical protein
VDGRPIRQPTKLIEVVEIGKQLLMTRGARLKSEGLLCLASLQKQ